MVDLFNNRTVPSIARDMVRKGLLREDTLRAHTETKVFTVVCGMQKNLWKCVCVQ